MMNNFNKLLQLMGLVGAAGLLTALQMIAVHAQTTIGQANSVSGPRPFDSVTKSIKGSGTPGRIPKFIGSDVIGDSVIIELNGNIGIGFSTPGSKLTVAGRIEAFNTGVSAGVLGQSPGGSGVRGNSDTGLGVFGSSTSAAGTQGISNTGDGVFGFSQGGNGVRGDTSASGAAGVHGFNNGSGGTGVVGRAFNGTGVRGISSTGFGVFGSSDSFTAVEARSDTGFGLFARSNTNTGVHGESDSGLGVIGISSSNDGVVGQSNGDGKSGVYGFNGDIQGFGVFGRNTASGSAGYVGGGFAAVAGFTTEGDGLHGESNNGNGVAGISNSGDGVLGQSSTGFAGNFIGNVQVTGNLSKGGGSFKIDHPLDPENRYLSHSFVESPDMMNIYNGNVALDQQGEAVVNLPEWFQTLNKDFRYSLTAIGAPAPNLFIAEEVAGNRFKIAGGTPGVRVSWQITGIRHDPYANKNRIKIEEEKPEHERGRYLHPELFGEREEKGIGWVRSFPVIHQTKETLRRSGKD